MGEATVSIDYLIDSFLRVYNSVVNQINVKTQPRMVIHLMHDINLRRNDMSIFDLA